MKSRPWACPGALALLTACGLISALCGDGLWDGLSWAALAAVLVTSVAHAIRGRH